MRKISTKLLGNKFFRYLVVGGIAFAVEYGSFLILYGVLNWRVIVANTLSFCAGLLASFLLNKVWTFGARPHVHRTGRQFQMYVTLALCNLGATLILVAVLQWLGLSPQLAKLLAMIITSTWNFFIFQRLIFKHHSIEP